MHKNYQKYLVASDKQPQITTGPSCKWNREDKNVCSGVDAQGKKKGQQRPQNMNLTVIKSRLGWGQTFSVCIT